MAFNHIETSIDVNTSFYAYHHWPEAPDHREYLRTPHPHTFTVCVQFFLLDAEGSRVLEFHDLVDAVRSTMRDFEEDKTTTASCEQYAKIIGSRLTINFPEIVALVKGITVSVAEEGYHRATIYLRRAETENE